MTCCRSMIDGKYEKLAKLARDSNEETFISQFGHQNPQHAKRQPLNTAINHFQHVCDPMKELIL